MRCRIYVRVSMADQRNNGYFIDSQLGRIKEYCKSNEYDIINIYNDAGYYGKDLMRTEIQLNKLRNIFPTNVYPNFPSYSCRYFFYEIQH